MLLKSLLVIGAIAGAILGVVGTSVPWLFPNLFTTDAEVIGEVSFISSRVSSFLTLVGFSIINVRFMGKRTINITDLDKQGT